MQVSIHRYFAAARQIQKHTQSLPFICVDCPGNNLAHLGSVQMNIGNGIAIRA